MSHDHKTQYQYVEQSLMLWKEIMDNMFMLWSLAEDDLLNDEHPYNYKDTGQGMKTSSRDFVANCMFRISPSSRLSTSQQSYACYTCSHENQNGLLDR